MAKKRKQINTNVAAIPWPTDMWGYTSDFRKSFTVVMSRLNGDDKKALLDEVMNLMIEFKENRFHEMQVQRGEVALVKDPVKSTVKDTVAEPTEEDLQQELFGDK